MVPLGAKNLRLVAATLLAAAVLFAFWPALGNGFTNLDDDTYVTENHMVREGLSLAGWSWAWTSGHASNWHPLTWLSHMLDWELFGENPAGHHATSLALHLLNTLLLFLLLQRSTAAFARSFLVAALFGVHPLHVESVAWIAERKDVLSTVFWLLTTLAYVRYTRTASARYYWLSVGLLAAGLCAKPMLVTLPFTLLLLDYWPLGRWPESGGAEKRPLIPWPLLREKLPMFALVTVSSGVTLWVQHVGSAVKDLEHFPLAQRISNAIVSYALYLKKAVWPFDLAAYYPHPRGSLELWQLALAGALLAAITFLALRTRRSRPYLIVGWLGYVATLAPVIGVVQVGAQAMADRYTYVPLIGIFVMLVWGLGDAAQTLLGGARAARTSPGAAPAAGVVAAGAVSAVVLTFLIVVTRGQVATWHDSVRLFEHAVTVTRDNAFAHYNLGSALAEAGHEEAAAAHYTEALRISPNDSLAHNNLGVALAAQGRLEEASRHYAEALRLNPELPDAHHNMGVILSRQGRVEEAVWHFSRALELEPGSAATHTNLALLMVGLGRLDEALQYVDRALELEPEEARAHSTRASALYYLGRYAEAWREVQLARRYGFEPPPELVESLAREMPEPG